MTASADRDRVLQLRTEELTDRQVQAIRSLLDAAFADDPDGGFAEDDWDHAIGGLHFVLERDSEVLVHASVVRRALQIAGRPTRTGYVEAVATAPDQQGTGLGTRVMREVGSHIAASYELGALGTGSHGFYQRLGWRTWRGPSSVRMPSGERPTPDEDGYIMVLATPTSPDLDLDLPISCEWRSGDVW